MPAYTPKVGGYNWRDTLLAMRAENADVLRLLERLARVTTSDKTRAAILEGQTALYRNNERIAELQQMEQR